MKKSKKKLKAKLPKRAILYVRIKAINESFMYDMMHECGFRKKSDFIDCFLDSFRLKHSKVPKHLKHDRKAA